MRRKGFTLVELMVVVAIIAILAAVAVPMYTKFKQKATASGPIKTSMGTVQALQAYFDEYGTFTGTTRAASGALEASSIKIGANLPSIEEVTWSVNGSSGSRVEISWSFGGSTKCPSTICNGRLCLECDSTEGTCEVAIAVAEANLGLDKDPASIGCAAP